MNKLTITITITDPAIFKPFEADSEEYIADDFLSCPEYWLYGADIEVEKE